MLPADGEVLQLRSALQAYAAAAEREAAQAARYGALVFETCTDAYVPDADLIENQAMIPDMSRVLLRLAVKKLVPFQDKRDRTADLMTASCDRFVISGDFEYNTSV